jgi:hypothetical protein
MLVAGIAAEFVVIQFAGLEMAQLFSMDMRYPQVHDNRLEGQRVTKHTPIFLRVRVHLGQFEPVLNREAHDNHYLWPGLLFPSRSWSSH